MEAADELRHVTQDFVLMSETIAHLTLQVIHESVSFRRCLLFKVFQKLTRHVGTLSQHIIKVTESVLPRLLLVLDVCVHLLAFTVDVCNDLAFIRDTSLLLLD